MKKKIVGVILLAVVMVLPFMIKEDKASASDSCETYTNYYFFSDIAEVNGYKKNMVGSTVKHGTDYFVSTIPDDAKFVSSGQVELVKGGNSKNTSTWSLNNFWAASIVPSNTAVDGNVSYIGHGAWYRDGYAESSLFTDLSSYSVSELVNATVLPTTVADVSFGQMTANPNGLKGSVSRTYSSSDADGVTPIRVDNHESYVMPALYYIKYDVCKQVDDERYKVNQFFRDEEGNTIKETQYGVKSDLKNGDSYSVSVPETITVGNKNYTLTQMPKNASGTINNSDVDVICIYRLRDADKFQVNRYYLDENNNQLQAPDFGVKTNLSKGDKYEVTCPNTLNVGNSSYSLVKSVNAVGTIVDSDVRVDCIYRANTTVATPTGNPSNPTTPASNPKTLDGPMAIIVTMLVVSFGCAVYYFINSFKKCKQM